MKSYQTNQSLYNISYFSVCSSYSQYFCIYVHVCLKYLANPCTFDCVTWLVLLLHPDHCSRFHISQLVSQGLCSYVGVCLKYLTNPYVFSCVTWPVLLLHRCFTSLWALVILYLKYHRSPRTFNWNYA